MAEQRSLEDISARNWRPWRKVATVLIVAGFSFLSTCAAAIIAPGREKLQAEYDLSKTASVLPLSLFTLGLAWGPVLGSPTSESIGRQPVFRFCMPMLLILVMACGFTQDFAGLLVCRFLAGLCGSAGISLPSAVIADVFAPSTARGVAMFCYYSMPFLGSVVGALVGYLIESAKDWEWTQWVFLFIAVPVVIPGLLFLDETKQSAIEARIESHHRPAQHLKTKEIQRGITAAAKAIPGFLRASLLRPLKMLFTELIVSLTCLYAGFNFGVIYGMIIVLPEVFKDTYDFGYTNQGLAFLGMIAGCLIGPASLVLDTQIARLQRSRQQRRSSDMEKQVLEEKPEPEHRLRGAMFGSILIPVGLIWFAWTAQPRINFLAPIFACILITWGCFAVYVSCTSYVIDVYGPVFGASANGANAMTRYTMASIIPLFVLQMFDGLGTGWAATVLFFFALLMIPIPFCFFKWGPLLRARCRFTTES